MTPNLALRCRLWGLLATELRNPVYQLMSAMAR